MGEVKDMSFDTNTLPNGIVDRIQEVLESLRPAILQDGGDIHFVRFENGTVYVQLYGACVSCPISFITLKMGLEAQLKEKIPGVNAVVAVDDE
jgi:Fe-S cluster biogenesis protein NfuA